MLVFFKNIGKRSRWKKKLPTISLVKANHGKNLNFFSCSVVWYFQNSDHKCSSARCPSCSSTRPGDGLLQGQPSRPACQRVASVLEPGLPQRSEWVRKGSRLPSLFFPHQLHLKFKSSRACRLVRVPSRLSACVSPISPLSCALPSLQWDPRVGLAGHTQICVKGRRHVSLESPTELDFLLYWNLPRYHNEAVQGSRGLLPGTLARTETGGLVFISVLSSVSLERSDAWPARNLQPRTLPGRWQQ